MGNSERAPFIPYDKLSRLLPDKRTASPGKTVIDVGPADARTSIVADMNSEIIYTKGGLRRSRLISSEIHNDDTDVIRGLRGTLYVVVGEALENARPVLDTDGSEREGEMIGDGVINGEIYEVRANDMLVIPAGKAHVHGTRPNHYAAALFTKTSQ